MSHRQPLVFVPANGMARPVYRKMLVGLSHRFVASGMERLGHDPAFPVTEAWPRLVDQLRPYLAAAGGPVTLLGHGSGGWLALLAAYRAPERVRAVILLDAPVPGPAQARLLAWVKRLGLGALPGPACGLDRPSTSALDPDCLPAYRRFACESTDAASQAAHKRLAAQEPDARCAAPDGRRFDAAVRRRLHATWPDAIGRLVAGGAPVDGQGRVVPVGFLLGTQSPLVRRCGLAASRRLAGDHLRAIEGSHLFPLERPLVTAKEVVHLHDRMVRFAAAPVAARPVGDAARLLPGRAHAAA